MSLVRRVRHGLVCLSASVASATLFVVACTGDDAVLSNVAAADGAPNVDVEDAGMDALDRQCDPAKDFGEGIPVGGLATAEYQEYSARFSPDERVVYFVRAGAVDGSASNFASDIYTASRASTLVGFDTPRMMTELGGAGFDDTPTVTADGQGTFFVRSPVTGIHIWKTTGKLAPFSPAEEMPGPINEGLLTLSPYVLPDGSALYLVKDLADGAGVRSRHVFRAGKGDGSYSDVKAVVGLGTEDEESPAITPDELTIYWSAQRSSVPTKDIFVATRADATSPFSGVHRLASLNTTARDEAPTFISADGCRLYYSSTIRATPPAVNTVSDIFVATKPR